MTAVDLQSLWAGICEDDEVAFAALADYYEEQGDTASADCLRWCAERYAPNGDERPLSADAPCEWWDGGRQTIDRLDPSDIPTPIFLALVGGFISGGSSSKWKEYDSRLTAWRAMLKAWPVAIAAGWKPDTEPKS